MSTIQTQIGKDEVLIDAPASIAWDTQPSAVVQVRFGDSVRTALKKSEFQAAVVAVRLETGAVLSGVAVMRDAQEAYRFDLRQCLKLDWNDATYLVTLFVERFSSNTIRVRLEKSGLLFHDPEVVKFLAKHRRQARVLAVWPAAASTSTAPENALPFYRRSPESPEVPEKPGVVMSMAQQIHLNPGARAVLRGSFRSLLPDRPVVPDRAGQGYLPPTTIVSITLLIVGDKVAGPTQLNLQIPSFSQIHPTMPDQTANGFFAIDLLQFEEMPQLLQTYFIYAFMNEGYGNPIVTTFVKAA